MYSNENQPIVLLSAEMFHSEPHLLVALSAVPAYGAGVEAHKY